MRRKLYDIIKIAGADSVVSRCYDAAMIFFIVCSLIPLCFKETTALFQWMDQVSVTVFIIDYLLHWITADFRFPKRGKLAFLLYPVTLYAIIDLLAILPSLALLHEGVKLVRLVRMTWLVRLLRGNKGIRALKLLHYSHSFNTVVSVIKREREPLLSVMVLAIGYVFLCAVVMFQVEPDSFDTFFDAIYWAMVTLTTVGYGDIYPSSVLGRVVSMVSSFVGIAIVALPTGIITAGFMSELSEEKDEKGNDTSE